MANSEAERSIQEVQAAMVIAKKFPRDSMKALDRIINACTRPTWPRLRCILSPRWAGSDWAEYPLGRSAGQEWGNIQFGIRELSSANGASTVEAFAWDMETNTRQVKRCSRLGTSDTAAAAGCRS